MSQPGLPNEIQEPLDNAQQGFATARAGARAIYNGLTTGNYRLLLWGIITLIIGLLHMALHLNELMDTLNS